MVSSVTVRTLFWHSCQCWTFKYPAQDHPSHRKSLHEVHSGANPVSNSGPRTMWSRTQLRKSRRHRWSTKMYCIANRYSSSAKRRDATVITPVSVQLPEILFCFRLILAPFSFLCTDSDMSCAYRDITLKMMSDVQTVMFSGTWKDYKEASIYSYKFW